MKKRVFYLVAVMAGIGLAQSAHADIDVTGEAGVKAFTSNLNTALRAGPAWGANADLQGHEPLGLELSYAGASNQLFGSGSIFNGPRDARVIQNGGDASLHVSIARDNSVPVEPFVVGGIGFSDYHVTEFVPGYRSDTLGSVPLGLGVNFHPGVINEFGQNISHVTLGVRGDYDILFSDQFSPSTSSHPGDSYRGMVTLGGSF